MSEGTVALAPLEAADLEETARLHVDEMPLDLASRLGRGVVREIYHRGMLSYPGAIGFVARVEGRIAGLGFAQIDFAEFAKHQRRRTWSYYSRVGPALLRRPWLIREAFAALDYLRLEPVFTNIGPVAVGEAFRSRDFFQRHRVSLGGLLTERLFAEVKSARPELPVLTMIRPSNVPSIAMVAAAARAEGFSLLERRSIWFGRDERFVFRYGVARAAPQVSS